MKASELIVKLQKCVDKGNDFPLKCYNKYGSDRFRELDKLFIDYDPNEEEFIILLN